MERRRPYLVFFALVALVVALGFAFGRRHPHAALDAAPGDAWLVVAADVATLRSSPLGAPVLGAGASAAIPGVGSLADACGFDPLARVRDLVLAAPEGGERGDFGVAFTGDFTPRDLSACSEKVMRARGAQPSTSSRGDYTVVEEAFEDKRVRFAYRDGGPFLVGRGAWLDAMVDAVDGKHERATGLHAALRDALAPSGAPPRTVVLTAVLPKSLRERLKGELGSELGSDADRTYASVLAVEAAGIALTTGGAGSSTQLAAELRCETAQACDDVAKLIERKRLGWSQDVALRLVGLGPLLDSLSVQARGTGVSASASAATDDLARVVRRVLDFRAAPRAAASPDAGVPR